MLKPLVFALALAGASATAAAYGTAPARAMDSMMKMDCSQAGSMMSDAAKGNPTAMSGDIDKDYMAMMMDREKTSGMLMKIEAACGKDPKMKAMAAKQQADSDARMQMFRNQNMSQ